MARVSSRLRIVGAALAAALLLGPAPRAAQPENLRQLAGIEELKSWFNANQAHPKIIVLLSPT